MAKGKTILIGHLQRLWLHQPPAWIFMINISVNTVLFISTDAHLATTTRVLQYPWTMDQDPQRPRMFD